MSASSSSPPPDGPDDAVEIEPSTQAVEHAARVASTQPEAFGMDIAVEDGIGPSEEDGAPVAPGATAGVARNTAIFSIATGASRIAGLAREVVAASYFGTSGAASAFTIAFQVPNLVRGLFADAALSAAFVPIFAEYLEKGKRREAVLLASTLFWIILLVLGAITALFIVGAGVLMPLFIPGSEFSPSLVDLTVGLSQLLFPVVVLLGINGLLVGIAQAYHHFTIPALAPLVWNVVIIGALVVLHPLFHGQNQIYAYAIGVLLGTIIQLLMVIPVLGRIALALGSELIVAFSSHAAWRPAICRRGAAHLDLQNMARVGTADPGVGQTFALEGCRSGCTCLRSPIGAPRAITSSESGLLSRPGVDLGGCLPGRSSTQRRRPQPGAVAV